MCKLLSDGDVRSPPRPSDPIFSAIWDLTYGPACMSNPLNKLGQQIEGLKDILKTMNQVVNNLNEINKNIKEATGVLKETNISMKEASIILQGLSEKL